MATFVKDKTTLILEVEGTSGSAETPTSTDHDIKFFDVSVSPEIETYAQAFASGRHSKGPATTGKRKVTFTAKAQLLVAATAGQAPNLGKAFRICGQNEEDASSVAYTPNAGYDEGVTATIWAILVPASGSAQAVVVKAKGCMGNCVLSMESLGAPVVAEFTFTGALIGIEDGSALAMDSGLDVGPAPATVGALIALNDPGEKKQQVSRFSLDFGNTVELDMDAGDAAGTGYRAAYISQRNPVLSLTTKLRNLTGDDHFARWKDGDEVAFEFETAVVNGQHYRIHAPKAQVTAMPMEAGEGGMWSWGQTYELHEEYANDAHLIELVDNT